MGVEGVTVPFDVIVSSEDVVVERDNVNIYNSFSVQYILEAEVMHSTQAVIFGL